MIGAFLSTLSAWVLFIMIVCVPVLLTYAGFHVVRKRMNVIPDDTHNVVAGIIFSTVSLVYTVILAFLIITVWQSFQDADQATSQEAAAIVTVARDTSSFPRAQRIAVLNHLRAYTELVINDEWSAMRRETNRSKGSAKALAVFDDLWSIYHQLPSTAINANAMRSLDTLSEERVVRLMDSKDVLPDVFWFVLFVGAVVTIGCCLILHMKNTRLHLMLTLLLTICLWLIVIINNPFGGDLRVSTDAFEYALHVIDTLPH